MEISRIEKVYRFLGLNQKQFAEALGFSPKMIKNYSLGSPVSGKFISALEKSFPEININYLRGTEDNMLCEPMYSMEAVHESKIPYICQDCISKDLRIQDLEKRISDKEELIEALQDQVRLYKSRLGDCEELSKQA